MAKKVSSALIGRGVGPFVRLGGVGALRITGLPSGESARLLLRRAAQEVREIVLAENGRHVVEEADFVQVVYEGTSKGFCALLES